VCSDRVIDTVIESSSKAREGESRPVEPRRFTFESDHLPVGISRLHLKTLDALDDALELMYFGLKGMTRDADDYLGGLGLSRVHHRILFVIARRDGVTVGELLTSLGVSKQATHRPMRQLLDRGYVAVSRDPARHRYKSLHLTQAGRQVEQEASDRERAVMRAAFAQAGPAGREAWSAVMQIAARHA